MPTLKDKIISFIALILSGCHFLRMGDLNLVGIYLVTGLLLFSQIPIRFLLCIILLIYSFFVWINISYHLVMFRIAFHMPFIRLILILGTVIIFELIAILILINSYTYIKKDLKKYTLPLLTFLTVFALLIFLRSKIQIPILILDRFGLRLGILEAYLLGLYGSYLSSKFIHPSAHFKMRKKIWSLFSIVFFSQLFLGLFVNKGFLMTGKLHFPIPALIIGGPIYRGGEFFMLFLFLSTILLVGPAWCSHLCYVGGLDAIGSSIRQNNYNNKKLSRKFAWFNLCLTIFLALFLKYTKPPNDIILIIVANFGILSLVFILFISPLTGKMSHCISWCPLGLLSPGLGKINPFRITVDTNECKSCSICVKRCPYEAIDFKEKAKINGYCTLCGDCIALCPHDAIHLTFFGKKSYFAYHTYLFLLIVIHTLFLGLARI